MDADSFVSSVGPAVTGSEVVINIFHDMSVADAKDEPPLCFNPPSLAAEVEVCALGFSVDLSASSDRVWELHRPKGKVTGSEKKEEVLVSITSSGGAQMDQNELSLCMSEDPPWLPESACGEDEDCVTCTPVGDTAGKVPRHNASVQT